jgi:hypothetical protein
LVHHSYDPKLDKLLDPIWYKYTNTKYEINEMKNFLQSYSRIDEKVPSEDQNKVKEDETLKKE